MFRNVPKQKYWYYAASKNSGTLWKRVYVFEHELQCT